ncbi:hypothetical protein K443DRAFT_65756, partial [Laccaria amethystina LaAM-08-1]
VSCTPPTKKNSTLDAGRSRSSRVYAMVKELQFDFDIDLGLEEGENSDVVSQRLDQTFSIPFALRIHPSSKR